MQITRRRAAGCLVVARGVHSLARRMWVTTILLLFGLLGGAPALAERPGFEILDCVVDAELFDELAEMLSLSEAQRNVAQKGHEDYFESVRALEEEVKGEVHARYERMGEVEKELSQRGEEPPYERIAEMWNEVLPMVARANREGDSLVRDWFTHMRAFLSDEQAAHLPEVERMIRRENLLAVSREGIRMGDFHHSIDVMQLLEDAMSEGGELAALFDPRPSEDGDIALEEAERLREEVKAIRLAHELTIDAVLRRSQNRVRYPRHFTVEDVMPYSEDSPKARESGRRWARLHRVRRNTVDAVAALARDRLGEEAARRWEVRFFSALAPTVFYDLWLETEGFDRVLQRDDLQPDQRDAIEDLRRAYRDECHRLREDAYRAGVAACERWGSVSGRRPEQVRFARAVMALNDQHDDALEDLRLLLVHEQLEAFDRLLAGENRRGRDFRHYLISGAFQDLEASRRKR